MEYEKLTGKHEQLQKMGLNSYLEGCQGPALDNFLGEIIPTSRGIKIKTKQKTKTKHKNKNKTKQTSKQTNIKNPQHQNKNHSACFLSCSCTWHVCLSLCFALSSCYTSDF